ncbi:MAG: hypothetical protein PHQ43_01030 [Dehalococcoidales bacterium]|nr:hypothetical protein [Dehalococcoidales bacterium]
MSDAIGNKLYYVAMTDKFMSGWGQAAGRKNKLVIGCDTYDEACIVEQNAMHRPEMIYINITNRKPYYSPRQFKVSYHERQDYKNWFIPGYFGKR